MKTTDRDPEIEQLLAEREVQRVLLRYCRAIDRRDYASVLSCYHPDATDDHGAFKGTATEFVDFCASWLPQFERTMHFMGNTSIDVTGNEAHSETYTIAYHRIASRDDRPARDHIVAFRYVDRFELRGGAWLIADRTCVFEWTRTDPVSPGWDFTDDFIRGRPDAHDWMITQARQ